MDLPGCRDIFGTAASWLGREVCEIKSYISYLKERCKIAIYSTNPEVEACLSYVHNALQTQQWYNPIFANELEEELRN